MSITGKIIQFSAIAKTVTLAKWLKLKIRPAPCFSIYLHCSTFKRRFYNPADMLDSQANSYIQYKANSQHLLLQHHASIFNPTSGGKTD